MFISAIPEIKKPIDLGSYDTLENKINALYDYATIRDIYIEVSNPRDIEIINPIPLNVIQIIVPLGTASYAMSVLKENLEILAEEVTKYIHGEDDYDAISESLDRCIGKSIEGYEKHNIEDIFTFDQNLNIQVYNDGKWYTTSFQYLHWSRPGLYEDLKELFNIRKGFFDKMNKTLKKAQQLHHLRPDPSKKPYTWDSSNAELEISELIYILCKKSEWIKIDTEVGGSFAKFKKEFFGLFGFSDKNYEKKVSQLLDRKKDKHFIDILAAHMPNTDPAQIKEK